MKLSMNLLSWYLRDFHPKKYINNDAFSIRGLRFLPEESIISQPDYVYFGKAEQLFADSEGSDHYIIINNLGSLVFANCNYEDLLNSILSAFDYFNSWESDLLGAVSEHAPLQKFSDILYRVVSNQIVISRLDGPMLAVSGFQRLNDPVWEYNVDHMFLHPDVMNAPYYSTDGVPIKHLYLPKIVQNVYGPGNPVIMKYLSTDHECVGLLAIKLDDQSWTELDMQIASFAEEYLLSAEEFTSEHSVYRSGASVVKSLLEQKPVEQMALARVFQVFEQNPFRVALICHSIREDYLQKETLLRKLLNQETKIIAFIFQEDIIAIIPEAASNESFFSDEAGIDMRYLSVFFSMPVSDPSQLPLCYEQAKYIQSRIDANTGLFKCEMFAFSYLIEWLHQNNLTPSLICPAFRFLREYDMENQSDLYRTLKTFIETGFNIRHSSRVLNIHENTMKYRIQKIKDLTPLTFKDEGERKYLILSSWLI